MNDFLAPGLSAALFSKSWWRVWWRRGRRRRRERGGCWGRAVYGKRRQLKNHAIKPG